MNHKAPASTTCRGHRQGCAPGRAASLQNSRTGFKSLRPCSCRRGRMARHLPRSRIMPVRVRPSASMMPLASWHPYAGSSNHARGASARHTSTMHDVGTGIANRLETYTRQRTLPRPFDPGGSAIERGIREFLAFGQHAPVVQNTGLPSRFCARFSWTDARLKFRQGSSHRRSSDKSAGHSADHRPSSEWVHKVEPHRRAG